VGGVITGKIITTILVITICAIAFNFCLKEAIVEHYSGGNDFRYTWLNIAVIGFLGSIVTGVVIYGGRKK